VAFNSFQFLVFFPAVLVVYFLLPFRARWVWLLLGSLYFYGLWPPLVLIQILAATAATFYIALRIDQAPDKPKKKSILRVGVVLLVLNLVVFKYTGFVNESVRSVFGWFGATYPVPVVHLLLPLGISFYTFSLISYLIDVSNGMKAERHAGIFTLYVTYFPKLVAGPIERAKTLLPQLHKDHAFEYGRVVAGLQLIAWGAFKKVVVADRLAPFVDRIYGDPQAHDGVAMALATWAFAFQVYCDFSGYSDIAIGVAQTMGYKLMDNFNRPYFAISIQDFWKRWHISLTSWLTDYLYTPLTRQKLIKMKLYYLMMGGLFVTFVISGFWHGAAWTFVAWGALHGFYLICSMMTRNMRLKSIKLFKLDQNPRVHHVLRIVFTFTLVCFAYVFFKAKDVSDAFYIFGHLFTGWTSPGNGVRAFLFGHLAEFVLAVYGILAVMLVDLKAEGDVRKLLAARPTWVRWSLYYACTVSVILLGAFYDLNQQFIYFRF
jgi:alginate O-acetyltransferase complex protein AlgI